MKKRIFVLFAHLMILVASCSSENSAFVGRWFLVDGDGLVEYFDFAKDGTGIANGFEISWKVEEHRIYLTHPKFGEMSFDYQLAGSKLILTDKYDDMLVFLKPGGSPALVGKWGPTGELDFETVEFTKDGKGNVDGDSFEWATDKNKLFIYYSGVDEYEYEVSGSTLTLKIEGETLQLKKK
jgi:hypothetical protein